MVEVKRQAGDEATVQICAGISVADVTDEMISAEAEILEASSFCENEFNDCFERIPFHGSILKNGIQPPD
jgi:hypothetical protein